MNWLNKLQNRIRALFQKRELDADMNAEMRSHIEMRTKQNIETGMNPEEARFAALRQFGWTESIKETCREQRGVRWLENLAQDIRYGARQLRKNPGFTAVAVLTLALGIGANTAIFSIVNAVLLKMLPVHDPQALVLFSRMGKSGPPDNPAYHSNVMMYEFLRDRNQSLDGLFAFSSTHLRVRKVQEFQGVSGQLVTVNYFSVLGVKAILGRTWSVGDEASPDVIVISHRFWQSYFAADQAIIGRTLSVSGKPMTVIGVATPEFLGLVPGEPVDLTVLLAAQPRLLPEQGNLLELGNAATDDPAATWPLFIMGRLKSNVKAAQARSELTVLLRQWAAGRKVPEQLIERDLYHAELEPGGKGLDVLRKRFSKPLWMLTGVVGCVFLIACANIANLLLARAASRGQEIAVRLAIGAGRIRLIQQLLTESILLTLLGGALGIVFAWWGGSLLSAFIASGRIPVELRANLDWRVLTLTAALSILAGIGIGLVPALRASAVSLTPALKGRAAASQGSGRCWNLSQTLVAAQLALSLCLLVGAGLFVSSLRRITAINPGFQTENLRLINFDWSGTGYDSTNMLAFAEHALNRVREVPGVSSASATFLEPLGENQSFTHFSVPGVVPRGAVERNIVWPDYFKTMGIQLVRGREFNAYDSADTPKVVIVNATLARSYFGDADPVGQSVWLAREATGTPCTIVGLVRDSTQRDLRDPPVQLVFLASTQTGHGSRELTLLVRGEGKSPVSSDVLRRTLAEVNRDISVREITTPKAQVERGLLQERLLARLTGFFGPLSLLLAAIGLYGLLAYEVAQRTREFGVRMALGARRTDVLRLVLKQGMLLVVVGATAGAVAASALSRVIRGFLFAIGPDDPRTLLTAVGMLGLAALLACWLPARRATKVDPMLALRHE